MKKFITSLVIFIVALFAMACAPAQAARVVSRAATTGYAHPEVLVDSDWVAAHLTDPQVRLMDVSSKREKYDQGHLPNAVYVNVSELATPKNSNQSPIGARLSQLGVKADTLLVLYDDMSSLYSARAFWLLAQAGHERMAILNGGSQIWAAENRALTQDIRQFPAGDYKSNPVVAGFRSTWKEVLKNLENESSALVDARSPQEYSGEQVRGARGGHIPGAINIEWSKAMKPDGTFRSNEELVRLSQRANISADKSIITYCQTGVRGAHEWFVLKYLMGFPNVTLYEGSWEEWSSQIELPVSISNEPSALRAAPTKEPDPCE